MKPPCSHFAFGLVAIGGFILGIQTSAEAAALANYNFTAAAASVDADANSIATSFASNYGNQSGLSGAGNFFVRVQVTPAVATTTNYFDFTVTAVSGFSLNLTNLTFRTALVDNGIPTFSGTTFVRSSVDGFSADLGSFTQDSTAGSTFTPRSIDLSGAAYQGLSDITFRFYHYDASDSTTTNAIVHRIDDVILNGDAIPEPASIGLLGIGALSLMIRRKR